MIPMTSAQHSLSQRYDRGWTITLMIAMGVATGMLAVAVPIPVLLIAMPAAVGLWIMAKWPDYAILAILVYTSTILSEEVLPPLPIGVGSLHLSDLVVLYLILVIGVRVVVTRSLSLRRTPLDLPILIFVGICIGSTAFAVSEGQTPVNEGIRSLRHAGYLVSFFLVTHLIQSRRQMRRLWAGITLLAAVTAVASLLQAVFGPDLAFIPGRVESLKTQGILHREITRVIPPGESLLYVTTIISALAMTRAHGNSSWQLGRLGLLAIGLVLTYRRMLWGSATIALLGAGLFITPAQRVRLLRKLAVGLAAVVIGLTLLFVNAPDSKAARSIQATGERLASIFDTDLYRRGDPNQQTLEQRAIENQYALEALASPTVFGHGLGAAYRPCLNIDDIECVNPSYLHNGYLAIAFNLGIVGLASFIWLAVVTVLMGLRAHAQLDGLDNPDPWSRELNLGCTLAFLALLPAMLLEPYIFLWNWTPIIAIILATIQWLWLERMQTFSASHHPITSSSRPIRQ